MFPLGNRGGPERTESRWSRRDQVLRGYCWEVLACGVVASGVGVLDFDLDFLFFSPSSSFFSTLSIFFILVRSRVIASPLWRSIILEDETPNFSATFLTELGSYGLSCFLVQLALNLCHDM